MVAIVYLSSVKIWFKHSYIVVLMYVIYTDVLLYAIASLRSCFLWVYFWAVAWLIWWGIVCLKLVFKLRQVQYNLPLTSYELHTVSSGPNPHYRFFQTSSKHSSSSECSSTSCHRSRSRNSSSSKSSSSDSLAAALWYSSSVFPSFDNVSGGIDQDDQLLSLVP